MDWHSLYAGIGTGAAVITAVGGLVWLIMTLITKPIKDDVREIKQDLHTLLPLVKTEAELNRMIDVKLAAHTSNCSPQMDERIERAINNHEKQRHQGAL